jgi:hypothetical protein
MKTLARRIPALLVVLVCAGPAAGAAEDDSWSDYQFLLGEWRGEGDGGQGKGSGGFSFSRDLQGKVLVRKNRTDFPATSGRPAFSHEDLMIVYPGEGKPRAIYFDSEGHVINYVASFSADKRTLTFISDATPSTPRFRLSYTHGEGGTLRIKFEIAAPGKPDEFKTYLEGAARREERPRPKE